MTREKTSFKSGFVAIVGAPNVGKSTLLNRLLGEKIAITSRKPQTTRNRILGIVHRPGSQMVFIDTPGIHQATSPLNRRIVDAALKSLSDVDLILAMIDAAQPDPQAEKLLLNALEKNRQPAFLVINKIDRVQKPMLLGMIDRWNAAHNFAEIVPISAKQGLELETLVGAMETHLPPGPRYFPPDSITDLPERFIAGEMIREKVFRLTGQEIPYATVVTVEQFDEEPTRQLVTIEATIHVERASQKGIIIGNKGRKLKEIGRDARKEIERMLGTRVFLKLFVRVQKNWSRDTRALRRFGY